MDSVSQAVLGAALGGVIGGRILGRAAVIGGAVLGTLPDMDVVINYGTAIANYTQHRGFSHSLLVLIPFGILLAVALHWRFPQLSRGRWLTFTLAILVTHPLLDTLTTYGTQLFWPLLPPLGTTSIFIIDPLYTIPLLIPVLLALFRPPAIQPMALGLVFSTSYLGWALLAQQMVTTKVAPVLAAEGLRDAPVLIQPMPFNTLLWRVTVMAENERLEMVAGVFEAQEQPAIERFPFRRDLLQALEQLPEGRRLLWFTGEFLDLQVRDNTLQATDIRLGVPGAHPFTFTVAERAAPGSAWQPVDSHQAARPRVDAGAASAYWRRLTGQATVLCLSDFSTPPYGTRCPRS